MFSNDLRQITFLNCQRKCKNKIKENKSLINKNTLMNKETLKNKKTIIYKVTMELREKC
jgi:hypothetical protein